MAVSKRTRYEVLRRDNNTCRYCGETAPDVKITIDHVTPVALGGSDKPENLVVACKDCNAGKSSVPPGASLVDDVAQDAVRWAAAIEVASEAMLADREAQTGRCASFLTAWRGWDEDLNYLPPDWVGLVDGWLRGGIPELILLDSLNIAISNRGVRHEDVFRYLIGVVRNKLVDLHNAARLVAGEDI